ncbi:HpcH/HpaI aldolase/citrate lyase family protein [Clostridium fallax]|uniref:Citrate lyase subunit beta / citryl-CoA lyase n=1 Tax=Clostridium fallax TaxID=1533 RepID=A0A1M4TT22_9CLOT|nr:aldolase/citrate lyase family protein [Clostridium fallax]SHE47621.1 citrate lyase subunit beta / citryl-CoA lyase [Clostridium fallax]SQB22410.1 citrate lyase subunit beta [Clostridium fallax]
MKKLRRTMLFLPGNNPGMVQTSSILGADSVILDLEDAVSINEKDSARVLVKEGIKTFDFSNVELVVRVNPLDSPFGEEDIKTIAPCRPDTLLIPKADEESIIRADEILTDIEKREGFQEGIIKLIALIETAYGLENVCSIIKSSKRIDGVLLGGEDLTSDLEVKRTKEGEEIFYARTKVATACKAMRISSIDTPFTDTDDMDGLKKDTLKGKSLGMTGKASINPRQIEYIHEVLSPNKKDIDYSLRVLRAKEEAEAKGLGVFSLDGKMVDAPVINRAKTVVSTAEILGLL